MHKWIAYSDGKTLGLKGSQGGIIVFDYELPNYCRLTVEKMSDDFYIRICDIYTDSFRFSFFSSETDAVKSCQELKDDMLDWILSYPEGVDSIGWSVFFEEC